MARKSNLAGQHTQRLKVPALLLITAAALTAGLSLPIMHVEKLVFWKDDYSILDGIVGMWNDRQFGLATLIFFFSIVFPYLKLGVLTWIWFAPMTDTGRQTALTWLSHLGKWSMLDVFVVAVLVVIAKAGSLLNADPRVGVWVFGGAILTSMGLTVYIKRLASE